MNVEWAVRSGKSIAAIQRIAGRGPDFGFRISDFGFGTRRSRGALQFRNPQSAIRNRAGITLMEVLISIFVLLFGLMGVAAIFPVGNHYVLEGEKFDQGSLLAQDAFEQIQSRGMLRPERWLYTDWPFTGADDTVTTTNEFIQPVGSTDPGQFNAPPNAGLPGPGFAFVIDPMAGPAAPPSPLNRWAFPVEASDDGPTWALPSNPIAWPVRRITLPIPDPNNPGASQPMTMPVAETIFRLRDDLAVALPERDDAPGIQRWNVDGATGNLLTRQYTGNFSWLATIVPQTNAALVGLQPALRTSYQQYEVSVVVFYKRDTTPSATSERLLRAELTGQGEVVLYGNTIDEVDAGLDEIKPGDWIALMGVNQATGSFMMKWYRLLALDEETDTEANHGYQVQSQTGNFVLRQAMLTGPDWHAPPGTTFVGNLRAAIVPGVASVVTRAMTLERDSIWNGN